MSRATAGLTIALAAAFLMGCKVEDALVIRNRSGQTITVRTSHTGQSVTIKNNSVKTLPHSLGTLQITQEKGATWQYDTIAIYDYEDQIWHNKKWIFIPVRKLHLMVQTNGTLAVQPPKGKGRRSDGTELGTMIRPKVTASDNYKRKNHSREGK